MAPEVNSSAPREYYYSSYDDVHGDNVEQSTIDKQDTNAKSVFDQKAAALKKDLAENGTNVFKELSSDKQTTIIDKAIQIFRGLADSVSIKYSTESRNTADMASIDFSETVDTTVGKTQEQVSKLVDKAREEAENELKNANKNNEQKITVSNDRNKYGSINGSVETTKDNSGNVTSLTVTSDKSGNSFTYKKEGDKFYQVDSQGNHIKDSSGNEKVYTLDDNNNLVRDNSNISTATRGTKPAKSSTKSRQPKITEKRDNNYKGNDTYYTRDDKFVDGTNTETIYRNKQGKLTEKDKFTSNSDGSYRADSTYHNGAYGNRFTRTAYGKKGRITDVTQAAKTAGLKPSSKYKGYYTDGNKVYRWDKGSQEFVMVKQASIPVQNKNYKPQGDTFYTEYTTGDGRTINRNKKGQITYVGKETKNKYGSYVTTRYYHEASNNNSTRYAYDTGGHLITNANQAAKTAGLKPIQNGKYTDGKNIYTWNPKESEFVKN